MRQNHSLSYSRKNLTLSTWGNVIMNNQFWYQHTSSTQPSYGVFLSYSHEIWFFVIQCSSSLPSQNEWTLQTPSDISVARPSNSSKTELLSLSGQNIFDVITCISNFQSKYFLCWWKLFEGARYYILVNTVCYPSWEVDQYSCPIMPRDK